MHVPDFLERRRPADAAVFLSVALSVTTAAVLVSLYAPACHATADGVDLGLVGSREEVELAIDRVESRASGILGYPYTLQSRVDYSYQLALKEDQVPIEQVETYLFEQIGEVTESSVLTVNGVSLGAADDDAALRAMLESVKAPYVHENTLSVEFVEPLTITREYKPTADIRPVADMWTAVTADRVERLEYTVQEGDTFSAIAAANGMTMEALEGLNPGVDVDQLWVGQTLLLRERVPFLSVRTVDRELYEDLVPFETEEIPDDTLYEGDTQVLTEGANGWAAYDADVTYVNGVEQTRTINQVQIQVQPVTQVVAVGTKERPKTMATGSFIWPVSGTITSDYGSRYIFGSYSFHSGLDIAVGYGTPIAAADGGKVIFAGAGTGSAWSYGNYVVIDHENGLQTLYAHCSSLCVSAGERVYQGQTIAKVGSTGRSTGNHCHFQVKVNGTTVSPWGYLP